MSIYMIGYDLHPSRGETYDDLLAAIPKVGTSSWHCLDSTWLVNSEKTAVDIRNELRAHVKDEISCLWRDTGKALHGLALPENAASGLPIIFNTERSAPKSVSSPSLRTRRIGIAS